MGTEIPKLDLSRIQATEGRDEQDRPTVVVTDGTTEVVLASGDSRKDNLAGASQLIGVLWDYQQRQIDAGQPLEPITVTYTEASTAAYDPADEERIKELRGSSPSVSGSY